MILTRATDNRLKSVLHRRRDPLRADARSGQRASARSVRRRSTPPASGCDAATRIAAPTAAGAATSSVRVIRDLGVALAMRPGARDGAHGRSTAQMGKAGAPMDGKDLHIGDFDWGILPPARAARRPATLTIAGMAMAFARERIGRVAVSFIGEGGIVARRMARGDQSVRRAAPAGDLLRREQSDGAVDAAVRSVGGARLRRQGGRLRHSRRSPSTARDPDEIAAALHLGGRAARATGSARR